MQQQHPDDRFALTDAERAEFRQIWQDLAGNGSARPPASSDGTGTGDDARPGWAITAVVATILVFVGLAAGSTFVVLVAAAGVVAAYVATHRR